MMAFKISIRFLSLLLLVHLSTRVLSQPNTAAQRQEGFKLCVSGKPVPLYANATDHKGVIRALTDLQEDIFRVTDQRPSVSFDKTPGEGDVIIVGSIGKSELIDKLISNKKINVDAIKSKWEGYLVTTIKNPFPNVKSALIIVGSDKRGTIYGIYELSKQIGVSPWHWWADVPPKKTKDIIVNPGDFTQGEPKVKYRGIFLNDEQPALGGWVKENYGGFNSKFYTKVFELILRLKGNFLWPAMWGQSFYTEDPLNPKLADEYGIVISTSHHEPMMRAHAEWQRSNSGAWNYATNDSTLREFWREGIKRMGNYESVVTLAMRGDGDEPMSEESNTALLQRIVADQRSIIEQTTNKKITETPQVWALYKEVQEYYDKGMRVPDDVTLLLCDDNWGNLRKLPKLTDPKRAGGYGIYYHFDYVGGPRNYKWINTNAIERVWEQMHLAYEYGANQIWIVNVGDLKPMEFPISFFLDYAWNPTAIKADGLQTYTEQWSAQQFGSTHAAEIASLLSLYTKYNARIKPELLNENTYSLENYNEFERVVDEYQQLVIRANAIAAKLGNSYQEPYYQLVLHPIIASANLYAMYYNVALNRQAVRTKDIKANFYADQVKEHYLKDSLITVEYHTRNNGKWNHMMSQTHIGYTYWQQPPVNKMPEVQYLTSGTSMERKSQSSGSDARHLVPKNTRDNVFFEKDNYVSIEANNTTRIVNGKEITWQVLVNHGRTGSAITAFPVTAETQQLSSTSPHIAYEFYTYSEGEPKLHLYFSPTLNFHQKTTGLRYAIAIDDEKPQIVGLNLEDNKEQIWGSWVSNNIIIKTTAHQLLKPGKHTVRFYAVDPGIVLQKLVVDLGGVKPSYLGPPETKF
jgi:hypothetical protein